MSLEWVIDYGFQSLVIAVISYLFAQLKLERTRNKATQAGVKALLRDRLISAIHKAKKQGFIYIHELENITKMFDEYKNLGGNGAIVHLMREVEQLNTKTDFQ